MVTKERVSTDDETTCIAEDEILKHSGTNCNTTLAEALAFRQSHQIDYNTQDLSSLPGFDHIHPTRRCEKPCIYKICWDI